VFLEVYQGERGYLDHLSFHCWIKQSLQEQEDQDPERASGDNRDHALENGIWRWQVARGQL